MSEFCSYGVNINPLDYFYNMFKNAPVYNAGLLSEDQIINLDHIERVLPHANVPVDPGAVDTAACEVKFFSGDTAVVLVTFATMQSQIQALTGVINDLGDLE